MSRYVDLKALGVTTSDLLSYAEYRDMHITAKAKEIDLFRNQTMLNNTGNSRQVRRQRERVFDKATLSDKLERQLTNKYPGQGLFMQGAGWSRTYAPGWPNEVRKPRRDYSQRYKALFAVLSDAPDNQGRDG